VVKIKDDLLALLVTELAVQLGSRGEAVTPSVEELAIDLDATQAMVAAGVLTQEQGSLHRQLHLNAFKMSLLSVEGVNDIALERMLIGLGKVVLWSLAHDHYPPRCC